MPLTPDRIAELCAGAVPVNDEYTQLLDAAEHNAGNRGYVYWHATSDGRLWYDVSGVWHEGWPQTPQAAVLAALKEAT